MFTEGTTMSGAGKLAAAGGDLDDRSGWASGPRYIVEVTGLPPQRASNALFDIHNLGWWGQLGRSRVTCACEREIIFRSSWWYFWPCTFWRPKAAQPELAGQYWVGRITHKTFCFYPLPLPSPAISGMTQGKRTTGFSSRGPDFLTIR